MAGCIPLRRETLFSKYGGTPLLLEELRFKGKVKSPLSANPSNLFISQRKILPPELQIIFPKSLDLDT
jgi:hypothetical protein